MTATPPMNFTGLEAAMQTAAASDDPNDAAFCECIAAALGAWRLVRAEEHMQRV